jgi:hypothetical protein
LLLREPEEVAEVSFACIPLVHHIESFNFVTYMGMFLMVYMRVFKHDQWKKQTDILKHTHTHTQIKKNKNKKKQQYPRSVKT